MLIADHFDTDSVLTLEGPSGLELGGEGITLGNVEVQHLEIDKLSVAEAKV